MLYIQCYNNYIYNGDTNHGNGINETSLKLFVFTFFCHGKELVS